MRMSFQVSFRATLAVLRHQDGRRWRLPMRAIVVS